MRVADEDASLDEHASNGNNETILWFKQTINNACGLYGILHAICNGHARTMHSRPSAVFNSVLFMLKETRA